MNATKRYVFAMTGASGQAVGLRALRELARRAGEVHVLISTPAFEILRDEAGVDWLGAREGGEAARLGESPEETVTEKIRKDLGAENVQYWGERNFHSPVASGSFRTEGMLIVPCTMKTLAGVACGYAETLVERAADVTLKEGRRLLIAPREMPFSAIHLENMLKLARLGVVVAPPVAAFYSGQKSIEDMVDFLAGKILDAMGVENDLYPRWEGKYKK